MRDNKRNQIKLEIEFEERRTTRSYTLNARDMKELKYELFNVIGTDPYYFKDKVRRSHSIEKQPIGIISVNRYGHCDLYPNLSVHSTQFKKSIRKINYYFGISFTGKVANFIIDIFDILLRIFVRRNTRDKIESTQESTSKVNEIDNKEIAQMQINDGYIDQDLNQIYKDEVTPIIQIEESIETKSESNLNKKKTSINESAITDKLINISRGFEIIGGTFVYKVKILNNTPHRINDIKIQVLSYPNDCLNADTTERIVSKVEPNGGFRSLEFKFAPTHDCVQGVVNSLVTYIDSTETLQTQVVEPIVIKSVCDLLKPLEGSKYEVLDIIDKLKAGAQDEITINDSAGEMFQRFLDVLPDRNFAITDSDSKELGGRFMGDITAAARGKYTNENIGLKITVLDNGDGGCTVHFKACGNDPSMLPTAVEEVKQILDTKALLVMNIMRTLNVIREACRVDTAHSVLLKLEELKLKIDGEVETSTVEKLDDIMVIRVMYDSIEEQLKDHDQERICMYCDHLEGMVETGLVKK